MVYKVIICILILPNKMNFSKQILGSSLSLPAYGREGQGQHLFYWRRFLRSKKRNSAAEKSESESEGGQKFLVDVHSPTPFLFARPSENYQNSASGFSLKKVRILFRTDSPSTHFVRSGL